MKWFGIFSIDRIRALEKELESNRQKSTTENESRKELIGDANGALSEPIGNGALSPDINGNTLDRLNMKDPDFDSPVAVSTKASAGFFQDDSHEW